MKRRILAAALSAALVLSLAACGSGSKGSSSSNPGGGSSQVDGSVSDGSQPEANGTDVSGSAGGSDSSAETGQPDGSQTDVSKPNPGANNPAGGGNSGSGGSGGSGSGGSGSGGGATSSKITLTLNRTNIELNKAGATFKLRYTIEPDIYDGLAVFTSSDTKVVTVDESGKVTAVAPGKATITVKYDSATATASINCNWTEEQPNTPNTPDTSKPDTSKPDASTPAGGDTSTPPPASAPATVDLSAFYTAITGKYDFPMPQLADDEILNQFYAGMTGISAEQRLIYICGMSMNTGEFGLVQVKDSKDVDAVKSIFQARIDAQVNGGAWYPMAVESWKNNSRVVSNGNYVMMVVHENCDDIVKEFNALF